VFYINAVNASTSALLVPGPLTADDILELALPESAARREEASSAHQHQLALAARHGHDTKSQLALPKYRDPRNLARAGWGVIFASDADGAIEEALAPLLERRQQQAGALFRILRGDAGHRPGEEKPAFLARHGATDAMPVTPILRPRDNPGHC
jgi:hypothetical protein